MIIVRVELHSAISGQVTELARMRIANRGQRESITHGDYDGVIYRGRSKETLDRATELRRGTVDEFPRQKLHVWNLVARMLTRMGYA